MQLVQWLMLMVHLLQHPICSNAQLKNASEESARKMIRHESVRFL